MNLIDKILVRYAKETGQDLDDLVGFVGWPSEAEEEPYFENLQHVINDYADDLPAPLPKEIIVYWLSQWAGTKVPITHPLVQDNQKWLKVFYDSEYDQADPQDDMMLHKLVSEIAGPELRENLSSEEETESYVNSPGIDQAHLYMMPINDGPCHFAVTNDFAAFMLQDGEIRVYDFEGNRLHEGEELPKIQNYITQGIKLSKPVTDPGELASILGNHLASLVTGDDGISLFDLP